MVGLDWSLRYWICEELLMNCLRCGTSKDKRLTYLMENRDGAIMVSEFMVCHNREKCRTRQQTARPAKMMVNESDAPKIGLWTEPTTSSGKFTEEKKRGDILRGVKRED